jgi:hypothetical protein
MNVLVVPENATFGANGSQGALQRTAAAESIPPPLAVL